MKSFEEGLELSTENLTRNIKLVKSRFLVVLLCCLLCNSPRKAEYYGTSGAIQRSIKRANQRATPAPAAKTVGQGTAAAGCTDRVVSDALVAQILAASTYPTQIVEAERWMQRNSKLKGEELAKQVRQTGLGSQRKGHGAIPLRS